MLEASLSVHDQVRLEIAESRLEQVLQSWAEPLIRQGKLLPLSASQLYAGVLAPIMFAIKSGGIIDQGPAADWLQLLIEVAVRTTDAKSARLRAPGIGAAKESPTPSDLLTFASGEQKD